MWAWISASEPALNFPTGPSGAPDMRIGFSSSTINHLPAEACSLEFNIGVNTSLTGVPRPNIVPYSDLLSLTAMEVGIDFLYPSNGPDGPERWSIMAPNKRERDWLDERPSPQGDGFTLRLKAGSVGLRAD